MTLIDDDNGHDDDDDDDDDEDDDGSIQQKSLSFELLDHYKQREAVG